LFARFEKVKAQISHPLRLLPTNLLEKKKNLILSQV